MFEQEIYQYRAEFKDYLKFFLRFKQTEPLTTLANYLDGRKDLAIQTIELEDWYKHFLTDMKLYSFLCSSIYTNSEEIINAREFLQFVDYKLEFLNAKFNENRLTTNDVHFHEFQKQLDIFSDEL
jgi:hypothetical protein